MVSRPITMVSCHITRVSCSITMVSHLITRVFCPITKVSLPIILFPSLRSLVPSLRSLSSHYASKSTCQRQTCSPLLSRMSFQWASSSSPLLLYPGKVKGQRSRSRSQCCSFIMIIHPRLRVEHQFVEAMA